MIGGGLKQLRIEQNHLKFNVYYINTGVKLMLFKTKYMHKILPYMFSKTYFVVLVSKYSFYFISQLFSVDLLNNVTPKLHVEVILHLIARYSCIKENYLFLDYTEYF